MITLRFDPQSTSESTGWLSYSIEVGLVSLLVNVCLGAACLGAFYTSERFNHFLVHGTREQFDENQSDERLLQGLPGIMWGVSLLILFLR